MSARKVRPPVWQCQNCDESGPVHRDKKYCNDLCRSDAYRKRQYAKGLVRTSKGWREGTRTGHELRRLSDEERSGIAELARDNPGVTARELTRIVSIGIAPDIPYRTVSRIARQARRARSARPVGLSA